MERFEPAGRAPPRLAAALAALWLPAAAAMAPPPAGAPVIRSIAFEGNDTTRPQVMLREMVVAIGDPADPEAIERSRQGIQDLGLFRSVGVRHDEVDGGVALTFVVVEKWYLIPIPRVDANSEGENAIGIAVRWYNVAGLNHTLRANWARRDEEKINKGESTNYAVGYSMPFVFDSPFGAGFSVGHNETPITDFGGYTETVENAGVWLSRSFARGPASQGFGTALALGWMRQDTEGPPGTPEPQGEATTLGLSAGYRDIRYHLYSEDGVAVGASLRGATEGLGSDYSFTAVTGHWARYRTVGERPHQNLNFFASFGSRHGGPTSYETSAGAYSLGGASLMRGYPADFVVGDFFYHFAAEYARPVVENWLRPVVVLELGNAFDGARGWNSRVYASLGLGLRLRLTFLVNVEVEAGVAWPLDGGDQRFFASKV